MALDDPRMTSAAIVLQGAIADLGNPGDTAYFAALEAGFIKEVHVVRDAAGGASQSVLTITTAAGAMTKTMALATGGAAGDVDSFEFSREDVNNILAVGEGFSIATGGEFAGTPAGNVVVVLEAY